MTSPDIRPTVLIIGPTPPPAFGVAKATKLMLDSTVLGERLHILHLDTSDRRSVANIDRFDWRNAWLGVKHLVQLVRLLAGEKVQVSLLTASQGTLGLIRDGLLALIIRASGSLLVVYLRGSGYANIRATRGRLADYILRSLLNHSTRVIVLGEGLVEMARSVCPEARVVVIPNGCPLAVDAAQIGARDVTRPVVAYIGRLSRKKGIDEAMRAAAQIVAAGGSATLGDPEFVLAGEWEPASYESHVRALVDELGLSDFVHLPGPVWGNEKAELLQRAWVLIVPSYSEGHPWVILEAMSAGLPVVATDTGAIAETVLDGTSGFVVPVKDSQALAGRVSALLQDDNLWTEMSRESSKRYQELFTAERSHSALADVLVEVASEK
jgi:glycosyltransferase involved in cell wall biosynthesis